MSEDRKSYINLINQLSVENDRLEELEKTYLKAGEEKGMEVVKKVLQYLTENEPHFKNLTITNCNLKGTNWSLYLYYGGSMNNYEGKRYKFKIGMQKNSGIACKETTIYANNQEDFEMDTPHPVSLTVLAEMWTPLKNKLWENVEAVINNKLSNIQKKIDRLNEFYSEAYQSFDKFEV